MRLKFWIKGGLRSAATAIGATAVYGFLIAIQSDADGILQILANMIIYAMMFGAIMPAIMNITAYKLDLHLALSMGSTRGEALVGLQVFRLVPMVLSTALVCLLTVLCGSVAHWPVGVMALLSVDVCLISSGIGVLLGVIITKFGKVAGVIVMILFFLVCAACGVFMGLASGKHPIQLTLGNLPWLLLGLGLVLYGVAMIPESRTVWKCNVKL